MKGIYKSKFKFVLSFLVSIIFIYYVLQNFDINETWKSIHNARPQYLILSFFLIILAYIIRGYRWIIWEKELKYWDSFKLILIGFMGNNLLPARLGEILRAHCTAKKTGENYGRVAALASIVVERVLDGMIISILGIIGLLLVSISRGLSHALLLVSLLFGLLTISLIVGIQFHGQIRNVFKKIHTFFPGHLTRFAHEKANYFLDGLLLIKGFRKFIIAIFITFLIWSIEINAYYLIANAVYPGVSFEICVVFLVVVNFASLFPFTIGGLGAIEGVASIFLISVGIPHNQALAMVVIQHAFQFGFTTLMGGSFYFSDRYYDAPPVNLKREKKNHKPVLSNEILTNTHNQIQKDLSALKIERVFKHTIDLSILIPAYNEQYRLPKTVLETIVWCTKNRIEYELIIIDDGSEDDTLSIAKLFATQIENIRYIACQHSGKGAAIRMGMLNSNGNYVLFMNADGATPLDEIPKLLNKVRAGVNIALGSRVAQYPNEIKVITSLHRKILGRIFAALVNIFTIPGFGDTQCGFKMFRKEIIHEVFSRQKINGYAFDVEILYLAKRLGFSIAEIPVNWINIDGSKVGLFKDSTKMLVDILRIRWIHRHEKWN